MTDTLTKAAHAFATAAASESHVDAIAAIEMVRAYITEPAKEAAETIESLRERIEVLEFALMFYADPANKVTSVNPKTGRRHHADVRARKALGWKAKQ